MSDNNSIEATVALTEIEDVSEAVLSLASLRQATKLSMPCKEICKGQECSLGNITLICFNHILLTKADGFLYRLSGSQLLGWAYKLFTTQPHLFLKKNHLMLLHLTNTCNGILQTTTAVFCYIIFTIQSATPITITIIRQNKFRKQCFYASFIRISNLQVNASHINTKPSLRT